MTSSDNNNLCPPVHKRKGAWAGRRMVPYSSAMNHAVSIFLHGRLGGPFVSPASVSTGSPAYTWIPRSALAVLTALMVFSAAPAAADPLHGTVVDVFSGDPVAGARVIALEAGVDAFTEADGTFVLDVAPNTDHTLLAHVAGMDDSLVLRRERQRVGQRARLHVFGPDSEPYALEEGDAWGAPLHERPTPDPSPAGGDPTETDGPVSLRDFLPGGTIGPLALSFPGVLPETIRIGRRMASSCSGNPVQRIDSVPLETYVQGVLIPEIGVFRAVQGGQDAAEAVFQAFAIAARSYALYFYLREPGADYHLDDTACNQRYEDDRNTWVEAQVAVTTNQILVSARDHDELDKFEYAASCGRHGTRPEYQDALVADLTGENACVRSWCGHNDCAAHEVNPALPDSGRCLVRGVCQWGAVERSQSGETYLEVLAHYQPNLDVITVGETEAITRVVGFVREGDPYVGAPVSGVTVTMGVDGPAGVSNIDGFYEITDAPAGLQSLTFSGGHIEPQTLERTVEDGAVNWFSAAVEYDDTYVPPEPEPEPTPEPPPEPVADAGPDDAGPDDASPDDAIDDSNTGQDAALVDAIDARADVDASSGTPSAVARYSVVHSRANGCAVSGARAGSGSSAPPNSAHLAIVGLIIGAARRRRDR